MLNYSISSKTISSSKHITLYSTLSFAALHRNILGPSFFLINNMKKTLRKQNTCIPR